jgi:hypothetical protein
LYHATLRSGERPYQPLQLIAAKAQRLLVPYVVISSAAYLPKVWLSQYARRPALFSLTDYSRSLLFPWDNAIIFFWFLPTLFLIFCAAPWTLHARASKGSDACVLAASAAISVITPHTSDDALLELFNLGGALESFVYFALGFVACKRRWLAWFVARRSAQLLALLLSCVLFAYAREKTGARLCLALVGIGLSCGIASSRVGAAFMNIGRHSFEIYLFSWFPQTFVKLVAARIPAISWSLAVALSVVAGLVAPVAIVRCLCALLPSSWHLVVGRDARRPGVQVPSGL